MRPFWTESRKRLVRRACAGREKFRSTRARRARRLRARRGRCCGGRRRISGPSGGTHRSAGAHPTWSWPLSHRSHRRRRTTAMQHVGAVMAAQVVISRAGVFADQEPGEEHHRDDEHRAGDDADPRQRLEQPAGSTAVGNVAVDWRCGRGVRGQRGSGVGFSCFAHAFDHADAGAPGALDRRCVFPMKMDARTSRVADMTLMPGVGDRVRRDGSASTANSAFAVQRSTDRSSRKPEL